MKEEIIIKAREEQMFDEDAWADEMYARYEMEHGYEMMCKDGIGYQKVAYSNRRQITDSDVGLAGFQ